jgi:hypothetical protein
MALEASHIRFALDIKDLLGVENIDAYVSGSIYPDSRYVTGVDRIATHPDDYRDDPMFRSTDFHKGWFAHLFTDTIQQVCMKELLPHTSEGNGQESWEKRTAIKMLQDIDDAHKFDLAQYLPCLEYIEAPNGESKEKMREYNQIFPAMYADISKLKIGTEAEMWRKFGVGDEIVEKLRSIAESYVKDDSIMDRVKGLYDAMLAKGREELRN